jgi:hypothetical protein
MKRTDLGATIQVLANVGVLAGIVFLIFELNQNNIVLGSQARIAQRDDVLVRYVEIYTDRELADVLTRAIAGEQLDAADATRLYAYQRRVLIGWQFQFEDFQNGALDVMNLNAMRNAFYGDRITPPLVEFWEEAKGTMRDDFVEFIEANVVNR